MKLAQTNTAAYNIHLTPINKESQKNIRTATTTEQQNIPKNKIVKK